MFKSILKKKEEKRKVEKKKGGETDSDFVERLTKEGKIKKFSEAEIKKFDKKREKIYLKYGTQILCDVCNKPFGMGYGNARKRLRSGGSKVYVHEYCMDKFGG